MYHTTLEYLLSPSKHSWEELVNVLKCLIAVCSGLTGKSERDKHRAEEIHCFSSLQLGPGCQGGDHGSVGKMSQQVRLDGTAKYYTQSLLQNAKGRCHSQ